MKNSGKTLHFGNFDDSFTNLSSALPLIIKRKKKNTPHSIRRRIKSTFLTDFPCDSIHSNDKNILWMEAHTSQKQNEKGKTLLYVVYKSWSTATTITFFDRQQWWGKKEIERKKKKNYPVTINSRYEYLYYVRLVCEFWLWVLIILLFRYK